MLEKLSDPANVHIAKPCEHALTLVAALLEQEQQPVVCEVGVGIGATSVAICRLLENRGTYHLFDYANRLDDLKPDLDGLGFTNVVYHCNSRRKLDSYSWSLAQMLLARRAAGESVPLFDFVFLDGAHAFHHDAPATLLLKELLKPGGVILFDDYDWSFAISPTMKPSVFPTIVEVYNDEQIATPHVRLICDLFMDHDPDYQKMDIGYRSHEHRRAYRKRGLSERSPE
ncbi:class I SAM-dependent methyltransferase [Roseomonas terrae]|jgi:predicted O-methyltransferase YrrM|uniref:Class I SAM-dependent methyltransferase n=1 Tax=Neoroseomonas terrae TaxID=424799 RepID=A0ABS5EG54_9PROT|nr:class I SAM-dependent methyltransferase [Neoroseomonas terrae]MBR0650008.1 class I SAM-dependent methyltransferase [Neoroseomonas terrae]